MALILTLAIPLNLVAIIGTIFGERLLHLPSAFALMALAWALSGAIAARRSRAVATAVLVALVMLWTLRSASYAARFHDRLSFYETSLREQPRSLRLYVLTAHENLRRGNASRAERLLCEALSLAPQYDELYVRLAEIAWKRGDFALARRRLDAAMNVQPRGKTALLYGYIDRLERENAR